LADKVWREDILQHAYRLVRANGGAPGIDGETLQTIEAGEGEAKFLSALQQELKEKSYRAQAVRRVYIPKADGKKRPLGIATIRDRVAQMAVKLVIEPIFEADFERVNQYVRGRVNYFHVHNSTRVFARQRFFLEQRLRKYLQKRRQRRGNGLMQWPASQLYQELGVYAIPIHAKYRRHRTL